MLNGIGPPLTRLPAQTALEVAAVKRTRQQAPLRF